MLTLATLAGQLTVFLVLLASLRVLEVTGSEVSAVEAFAAWSLARLLGSIPITPGGLGVVELGLATALVGFGGNQVEVVAAVLVYRFVTIVPTLVIGLLAGLSWKRYRPEELGPSGRRELGRGVHDSAGGRAATLSRDRLTLGCGNHAEPVAITTGR